MRTNSTPLTILAIAIAIALVMPQLRACDNWATENSKVTQAERSKAALEHWNGYVQPLRDLCVKKGGWPRVVPQNGSLDGTWQVLCDFQQVVK